RTGERLSATAKFRTSILPSQFANGFLVSRHRSFTNLFKRRIDYETQGRSSSAVWAVYLFKFPKIRQPSLVVSSRPLAGRTDQCLRFVVRKVRKMCRHAAPRAVLLTVHDSEYHLPGRSRSVHGKELTAHNAQGALS